MVTSVAMKALHGMFLCEPKANSLPSDLNAQIITVSVNFYKHMQILCYPDFLEHFL